MTPKAPSGTPRSWKSKFQAWLTRLTGAGLPPVSAPSPTPLAPQHPFLATEAVSEANRPGAVAQAIRVQQLMDRICAINNANVVRDYGTHVEDLTKPHQPTPLSIDDLADAKKLLGVCVTDTPGAKTPTRFRRFDAANYLRTEEGRSEYLRQAAVYGMVEEARLDVERSRRVQHPASFVPDLPSVAAIQAQIAASAGYEPSSSPSSE